MQYSGCFFTFMLYVASVSGDCNVSDNDRQDCGYVGIDQNGCQSKGCCWSPASSGAPWCFYDSGDDASCFAMTNSTLLDVPFSKSEIETMKGYFMANINIDGSGGVVASPDNNTPGGSYYYHWERDGALTMRALQDITENQADIVDNLIAYGKWVSKVQNQQDPNSQDVRTEPKYMLPGGEVYTGAWCRPQNDGPGLRAISLIMAADTLASNGEGDFVAQYLWTRDGSLNGGAIKYDLDYVVNGYASNSCDLWEEVKSSDFFWNRVTMKKAMLMGAAFAEKQGDSASANNYRSTAEALSSKLANHWNGEFIFESSNRQKDGAVIVGFNDGFDASDSAYAPTGLQVASTVKTYNEAFCAEYSINQNDYKNGVPGVMYGRYPGDTYAGGNPWVLTTAALGQLFYRAAAYTRDNGVPAQDATTAWEAALNVNTLGDSVEEVAATFLSAGDSVMLRLREHVAGDNFHLAEQIDRNTGVQKSAADLTWSYGEMLSALAKREEFIARTMIPPPVALKEE